MYYLRIVNPNIVIFYGQASNVSSGETGYQKFDYPYAFDNIMSLETSYGYGGWLDVRVYAGIFDWRISTGATCPRVPVEVKVNNCAPPAVSVSTSKSPVVINEKTTFTAVGTDSDGQIAGMTITQNGSTIQTGVSNNGSGTYSVELSFATKGDYELCATAIDNDNLSSTKKCVTVTVTDPTGVNETLDNNVALFPNPFNTEASIEISNASIKAINIYNMNGMLVEQVDIANKSTFGANLNKGMYMVEIISDRATVTKKIIKE